MADIHHYDTPLVPDQLAILMDDPYQQELHLAWQAVDLDEVRNAMPEPADVDGHRVVILDPTGDRDESHTLVLGLPYQQAWKQSHFIRAEYTRQAVAPDSRMIVLPNDSITDTYYGFSQRDIDRMRAGSLAPLAEHHVRTLEALEVQGSVVVTGYSMGAMTALGIAAARPDKFSVSVVNADEAPNVPRSPKELQRDFMASGGWGDQRAAIADANIPALSQAQAPHRLALDYARFGLAAVLRMNNPVAAAMAGEDFSRLLESARRHNPDALVKLGHVAGSHLFHAETIDPTVSETSADAADVIIQEYSGIGAHMHTTGDNVVAHALMVKHAVNLSAQRQ